MKSRRYKRKKIVDKDAWKIEKLCTLSITCFNVVCWCGVVHDVVYVLVPERCVMMTRIMLPWFGMAFVIAYMSLGAVLLCRLHAIYDGSIFALSKVKLCLFGLICFACLVSGCVMFEVTLELSSKSSCLWAHSYYADVMLTLVDLLMCLSFSWLFIQVKV